MSSLATSSPVSASTLAYLIRWPVFRFSWLKLIFSDSEVAGYSATGQVTSERRRKPFQFARRAMDALLRNERGSDSRRTANLGSGIRDPPGMIFSGFGLSQDSTLVFLLCSIRGMTDRPASWR